MVHIVSRINLQSKARSNALRALQDVQRERWSAAEARRAWDAQPAPDVQLALDLQPVQRQPVQRPGSNAH